MIPADTQELLRQKISAHLGHAVHQLEFTTVSGGSINESYHISTQPNYDYFCKINNVETYPHLFETEKNGLHFLSDQNCFRMPSVIGAYIMDQKQMLLLEWIGQSTKTKKFWKIFGEKLATLHHRRHPQFGFWEDNYIGSLPQPNSFSSQWSHFFIKNRLLPQIQMAVSKGLLGDTGTSAFTKLFKKLPEVFDTEDPSLLHGDLWSGNFLCDEDGEPVLIDPAIYFGHRSMDLAMTTLFGGFDSAFYELSLSFSAIDQLQGAMGNS